MNLQFSSFGNVSVCRSVLINEALGGLLLWCQRRLTGFILLVLVSRGGDYRTGENLLLTQKHNQQGVNQIFY